MAIEGWAMILLRQLPLSHQQITHILEPYDYQMPSTEPQFRTLMDRIRRLGHASENRPGTVARLLGHPAPSLDGRGHFHAITDHDNGTVEAPPAFMIEQGAPSGSSLQLNVPATGWTSWSPSSSSSYQVQTYSDQHTFWGKLRPDAYPGSLPRRR